MNIIDTHAHLYDIVFDADRADVISRARQVGISAVIVPGETLADAKKTLRIAELYPMIRPAAGLFPTCLDMDSAEEIILFIRENREILVAIGEVGLDYWAVKEETEKDIQRAIFGRFIELAVELDLPLNVHSRSAGRHAIEILLGKGARRVQMHAFDGRASSAVEAVEVGYFFSIPPSVVRSRQKQKLIRQLPLSCLLVETDSPVLGPVPGQRNEPANVMAAIHYKRRCILPGCVTKARNMLDCAAFMHALPDRRLNTYNLRTYF